MEMCPAEETRHLMQHLIFRVIHRDNAKSLSHFKYIGFDWNGIPAWYLWPKENPGVYAAKESWSESNGEFVRAGFTLYYYPHPEEEAFTDFSVVEQLVRVSDFFDTQGVHLFSSCCGHGHRHDHPAEKPFQDLAKEKGVPTPSGRETLCSSLYFVGSIRCTWLSLGLIHFEVESLVRSRTFAVTNIKVPSESADEMRIVVHAREKDRDVPCWHLSWLFSKAFADDLHIPYAIDRYHVPDNPDGVCHARFTFQSTARNPRHFR